MMMLSLSRRTVLRSWPPYVGAFVALGIERFGRLESGEIRTKSSRRDLVTTVDVASERLVVSRIRAAFPDHAIEAERFQVHRGPEMITRPSPHRRARIRLRGNPRAASRASGERSTVVDSTRGARPLAEAPETGSCEPRRGAPTMSIRAAGDRGGKGTHDGQVDDQHPHPGPGSW